MIALFIIAFALLAATAYTLYRRQQTSPDYRAKLASRPVPPRSLFDNRQTETAAETERLLAARSGIEAEERKTSLLKRAAEGDLTALADAHRAEADTGLYELVLHALLDRAADSEADLRTLAAFVVNDSDLRASVRLAEEYTKLWQLHPDRQSTTHMLHLAALADDPRTFERAIVAASEVLHARRLGDLRREELSALIESEYWVMSTEARRTGAGFMLKQRMNALREELAGSRKTETP